MTPATTTLATLVIGGSAAAREASIAAALEPGLQTAIILEGLPDGSSPLDAQSDRYPVHIARIAPGCPCCVGNLTMRVTLNRMLRQKPARLYIGLAGATHIEALRDFLQAAPYGELLSLTQDCRP